MIANKRINALNATLAESVRSYNKNVNKAKKTIKRLAGNITKLREQLLAAQYSVDLASRDAYNVRYEAAKQFVDENIISAIPEPTEYSHERVAELRSILANQSADTIADRIKIVEALHELKLYVRKFPLFVRIDALLKEWTGRSFIRTSECSGTSIWTDVTRNGIVQYQDNSNNKYLYTLYVRNEKRNADLTVHDYWEQLCDHVSLSISFILGEEFDAERKPVYKESCMRWLSFVRRIGAKKMSAAYRDDDMQTFANSRELNEYDANMSDETILAIYFVVNNPSTFTLGTILGLSKYYDAYCESEITERLSSFEREIAKYAFADKITDIKFDRDNIRLTWRNVVGNNLSFDPDTCEIINDGSVGYLDMSDAMMGQRDKMIDYACSRVDGLSRYGSVTMAVEFTSLNKKCIPKNIDTLGDNIFHESLKDCMSVSQWYGNVTSHYADMGDTIRYEFSVALKRPIEDIDGLVDRKTYWAYKADPLYYEGEFVGVAVDYSIVKKYRL